jgi:(1->4)-alpha-D-glucan 1-alpha-D-glucosylmutase
MPSDTNRFLADFQVFQRKTAFGAWNALSQTLLKITAPGVPDFYQGTEIWDFSLVDPDNRRPVDFALRKALLEQLRRGVRPAKLLAHWEDGRVKLYLIWKALEFRRTHPELFAEGEYLPVVPSGERSDNVIAFARKRDQEWAVSVAPRLTAKFFTGKRPPLGRVWLDTTLPLPSGAPSAWHNVLTGAELNGADSLALREVMAEFPVALLHGVG